MYKYSFIFISSVVLLFSQSIYAATTPDVLIFQVVQDQVVFDSAKIESTKIVAKENGKYSLEIKLKPDIAKEFMRISEAGIGKVSNIIFNKRVISTGRIQGSLGGHFIVSGLSRAEAEKFLTIRKN